MDEQDLNGFYALAAFSGAVLTYLYTVSAIAYYKKPRCLYNIINGDRWDKPSEEPKSDPSPTNSGSSLDERL